MTETAMSSEALETMKRDHSAKMTLMQANKEEVIQARLDALAEAKANSITAATLGKELLQPTIDSEKVGIKTMKTFSSIDRNSLFLSLTVHQGGEPSFHQHQRREGYQQKQQHRGDRGGGGGK